jgi:hypothetical protein
LGIGRPGPQRDRLDDLGLDDLGLDEFDAPTVGDAVVGRNGHRNGPSEMIGDTKAHRPDCAHF